MKYPTAYMKKRRGEIILVKTEIMQCAKDKQYQGLELYFNNSVK